MREPFLAKGGLQHLPQRHDLVVDIAARGRLAGLRRCDPVHAIFLHFARRDCRQAHVAEERQQVQAQPTGIVVHSDRLIITLKLENADEESDSSDVRSLTIPWQKPPLEGPARFCYRITLHEAMSVRSSSSAGRAWSA
jgi:hypothetical protein